MSGTSTDTFDTDASLFHDILHSTAASVNTEAGAVRTVHQIMADIQAEADAILPSVTPTAQAAAQAVLTAQKGAANGFAPLGADSKIAAAFLPSYVDDVLEFAALANFPATGETGKIYIDLTTNSQYRWSGTVYVKLTSSPGTSDAVPEGSTNLYWTNARTVAAVLTGYAVAATNAVVAATDTISAAIGKLQKQHNDLAAANTGDETTGTIKTKLGISVLSGSNTGDETNASIISKLTFTPANAATIGAASGIAPLGADSKIAAIYLPSYVDDVLEFANQAAFPSTGETGKIYVDLSNNKTFRWTGTVYIQLVASPGSTDAVAEGATNLYFTVARVLASVATGLVFSNSAKALATDTLLVILGKLQAQINAIPYDVMAFISGKPAVSAKCYSLKAGRAFTIPANFAGTQVVAATAATAASVWSLTKNGTQVGTFSWSASGTAPALATSGAAAISVAVGDVLVLTAAATQDASLADVSVHVLATLT